MGNDIGKAFVWLGVLCFSLYLWYIIITLVVGTINFLWVLNF